VASFLASKFIYYLTNCNGVGTKSALWGQGEFEVRWG